jgi:S-(hydroxymethyl)glutathione dehydrogenase/alcohol dehydrogenase
MSGVDEFAVEDVTVLDPGPRDVVVEIGASGVCHSDVSVLTGDAGLPPPVVLGHEGAGTVTWAGAEVTRVQVGDRVIASLSPVCGTCWYCRRNETHLCSGAGRAMRVPRMERNDGTPLTGLAGLGTFAEAMTTSQWSVVPVQTDLPFDQLALLGCGVSTGLGAVLNSADPKPGDTFAVIGCGGVGMAAIQGARIAGASRIIAIDPIAAKREAALALGASDAIDPGAADPVEQVRALTSRRGVDVAIDAVGAPALIEQAAGMTRRGGTTVLVGAPRYDATVTISPMSLIMENRSIRGSYYGSTRALRDFPRYVELIESGRLDVSSMVSRRISLEEVGDALHASAGDAIRHVVV